MSASRSDQPRVDALESCTFRSFVPGKMAVFDKTESLVCCNALLCLIRIKVGNSEPAVSQETLAVYCSVLELSSENTIWWTWKCSTVAMSCIALQWVLIKLSKFFYKGLMWQRAHFCGIWLQNTWGSVSKKTLSVVHRNLVQIRLVHHKHKSGNYTWLPHCTTFSRVS